MLKLIRQEIERLARQAPPAAEVRRARDYLLGQMDLHLESPENRMTWLGEQVLGYRRLESPDRIRKRLAAVKPSEIRDAARACFQPGNLGLAVITPEKGAAIRPGDWVPRIGP